MINQDESTNRNHINTEVSFNFINYMVNLLGQGVQNYKMGHSCINFKIKFLSLKQVLLLLKVFYFLYKFSYCLHSSSSRLVYLGKQVFEKCFLEQNENFLKLLGNEKNHGRNADWEEHVQTWWVNCVTHKCTSQYLNKNLKISSNHG